MTEPLSKGRRLRRPRTLQLAPVLWLAVVWVLLWGELTVANAVSGLLLGAVVVLVFPLPRLGGGTRPRPGAVVVLVLRFLRDLVTASAQVAWYALRPGAEPGSSVVVVPLSTRDALVQTLVVEMVSLVPGSIVLELDPSAPSMSLHVLGAVDEASVAAAKADVAGLERRVLRAVGADRVGRDPEEVQA